MSEFVLRDDLFDSPCRRLGPAPFKDTLERGLASYRGLKIAESGVRETSVIDQKHRHTGTYIGGAPNGSRLSCGAAPSGGARSAFRKGAAVGARGERFIKK